MSIGAILAAAGSGTRLGASCPKGLVELDGVPLVLRAAEGLARAGCVDTLVVTVPAGHVEEFAALFPGAVVPGSALSVTVTAGAAIRQGSVAAGLAVLPPSDVVLVHDAARCLTPPELIVSVVDAVRSGHRAVVPGLPVTDTVKEVGPPDHFGAAPVLATPPRAALRAVQTPQGFDGELLRHAHAAGAGRSASESTAASDDAGLVEALGERAWVVPGDVRAMKITTAHDLVVAELLLRAELAEPWGPRR